MLITIAAGALLVAAVGGLLVARRRRRGVGAARPPTPAGDPVPATDAADLAVGDVLVCGRDPLWLVGAVTLADGAFVVTLFEAEAAPRAFVLRLPGEPPALHAVTGAPSEARALPSDELHLGDRRFRTKRRGRARVTTAGDVTITPPSPSDYAVLESAGGAIALALAVGPGRTLTFVAEPLPSAMVDRLPGSAATRPASG